MMEDKGRDKRACAVWHRRAGKDADCLNIMAAHAHMRIGLYYYFAPTQKQARKVVWDNIGSDGQRPIDQAFPKFLREDVGGTNDQEMRINLKCGSIIQVLGSDNYDSVVGSNPVGVVFTEWSIATKPEAWSYFSPILAENHGWAIFPYTPRGLNHGWTLYNMAKANPKWFCELLTVDDTKDKDGNRIISEERIQEERAEGKSEVLIQQEYYCNFKQENEKNVFHLESVLEAMSREAPDDDPGAACIVGVDCARMGDDSSVIATRIGRDFTSIPLIEIKGRLDTQQLAYRIQMHVEKYQPDAVFVDVTGQGIGVYDELRRRGVASIPINFQGTDENKELNANIRCGMMRRFALWCEEPDVALHADEDLRMEMTVAEYHEDLDPHGRDKIISKVDMKKLLEGHSPDKLDACMLTFARAVMRKDVRAFRNRRNASNGNLAKTWSR